MKLQFCKDGYGISAKDYPASNGYQPYWEVSFEVDGQAGTMRCSKEVADMIQRFKYYRFAFLYNSDYKKCSVVDAVSIPDPAEKK